MKEIVTRNEQAKQRLAVLEPGLVRMQKVGICDAELIALVLFATTIVTFYFFFRAFAARFTLKLSGNALFLFFPRGDQYKRFFQVLDERKTSVFYPLSSSSLVVVRESTFFIEN